MACQVEQDWTDQWIRSEGSAGQGLASIGFDDWAQVGLLVDRLSGWAIRWLRLKALNRGG